MKMRKILAMVMALALTAALAVGGTLAYLTSHDSVTNTFTVGNVQITLDETDVKPDGTKDTDARVQTNEYHLLPGHSYIKDPTIHVGSTSEDCWLFVKVEDGLAAIEADTTIAAQMTANGWTPVANETGVYAYNAIVSKDANVPVFGTFTLKGDANVADYANARIVVTAYAVQADGFSTATAAWAAAPVNDWGFPPAQG